MEEAFESLQQYVQLRSRENEARVRLGEVAVKVTEQEDLEPELRGKAFQTLVAVVRDTGDIDESDPEEAKRQREANAKLRRKLVDIQTKFGAPTWPLATSISFSNRASAILT